MHIAQVFNGTIPPIGYGGIERVIYWLIKEFINQGHQVSLIANVHSGIIEEFPQIKFYDFTQHQLIPDKTLSDIDLFHFHNEVIHDWLKKYPYVVTEHGNNKKKKQYERNTVFLSQSHAENHNAKYYLSNGIPLDQYPLQINKKKEIAFMAKLNWRTKNARTAIDLAFDSDTPIHLSGGHLKNSRKVWGRWCLKYPFMKHLITEHGDVDGDEKLNLLKNSMCLFYLVNWHEPFALAPHEAMACGTPVLASSNGALKEYIKHGENGFLVNNYSEAIDTIKLLKGMSTDEQARIAENCRQSAYSIQESVKQHLAIYEKIISSDFLYSMEEANDIHFSNPPAIKVKKYSFL